MPDSRNHQIEQVVLSVSNNDWHKTAMILARTMSECDARGILTSYEEIAAIVRMLCEMGQLESVGDIANWRHSELRLVASTTGRVGH